MPPCLPKSLRAGSSLLAAVLLAAMPAAPRVEAAPQDAEAAMRSGLLQALIVLKIAPYLTPEAPRGEHKEKEGNDGCGKQGRREYRIALVGTDDVCRAATQLFGDKRVGEAKVKIVVLPPEQAADPEIAAEYELLYLATSVDTATLKRIVAAHAGRAIAVVNASAGFAAIGGGVQLFVQDNVVKFEINAEVLRRQGLRVDSQLLRLSKKGPS